MTPSERAGREIWYKATAGNDRFHTYVFQQRMGVLIDWWRVLRGDKRDERFKIWGLVNNPGCCTPGSEGCPARSYEETFGFDWCHGDDELLRHVGRQGYRDPACDFADAPMPSGHPHAADGLREDSCHLAFGTSTGAMGLRKFPNPRFDADAWRKVNGGKLGTWEGFARRMADQRELSDYQARKLADASVEPPYLIGMACGACHIAFDPANPPADPANPEWNNLVGAIGNQYARMSEIMVSGMSEDSLQWQVFSHTRPGVVDTSAVPTDQVNNPGTMNALINVLQRPRFENELVDRWRPVASCPAGADPRSCWCESGKPGKCWNKSTERETVFHILKGGEDSVGDLLAVQRVYINIGSCSEQCWLNHLTDLYQVDPEQRNFGQTPFDIGQCRRDCPNFRAIEDRAHDVINFLLSKKAYSTPLWKAKGLASLDDWIVDLDRRHGDGTVDRGRVLFAENCARCHSSQQGAVETRDFHRESDVAGVRTDWLGNDQATPASEVGTFGCRALHSNHMKGHVWEEFASETYRAREPDSNLSDQTGGGRGYYRNVSLVDLWAHAPFMHNNAIGPELCGKPSNPDDEFYRSPYVDADGKKLADPPDCFAYDPSVEGRYKLFLASVEQLLNPQQRIPKTTLIDQPIRRAIGPKLWDGEREKLVGIEIEVPAGTPAGLYGSFRHKELLRDMVLSVLDNERLQERMVDRVGPSAANNMANEVSALTKVVLKSPDQVIGIARDRLPLLSELYSTCTSTIENAGHRFGEDLSPGDKQALTAFLSTL
ncbi:MAG: cytochrome c [Gammaproteobacteria bacterium]|nr:cytochrome c [Gammaproteobacteria bacterium]